MAARFPAPQPGDRRCSGEPPTEQRTSYRELPLCVSDFADTPCGSGAGHTKCVSPFETYEGRVIQRGPQMPLKWPLDLDLGHAEGTEPSKWSRQQTNPRSLTWGFIMERVTRIELALSAWEADVLPLNYTRVRRPFRDHPEPVSDRLVTVPHHRPPALTPRGLRAFQGVDVTAGYRSWGVRWRGRRGSGRGRSAAWRAVPLIP